MICVQRCKCNSQVKGEDTPLYGKDESQDSVTKHDLRQSALAHLQSARPKREAHTAARNVSRVLESCQRKDADERGVQAVRVIQGPPAWSAVIRMDGLMGAFAWKTQPM
jgi:hypothetical protein